MTERATRESFSNGEEALINALRNLPTEVLHGELIAAGFSARSSESIRKKRARVQTLDGDATKLKLVEAITTLEAAEVSLLERLAAVRADTGYLNRTLAAKLY